MNPVKLMCGNCGERAGTALLGPTPNGGRAWSVTSRRVIEGARPGQPSDWMETGLYVDPKAPSASVLACPYCGVDLDLQLSEKADRLVLHPL